MSRRHDGGHLEKNLLDDGRVDGQRNKAGGVELAQQQAGENGSFWTHDARLVEGRSAITCAVGIGGKRATTALV